MHELERQIFYLFSFIPVSHGILLPWLATLFMVGVAWLGTRSLRLVPGPLQNVLEWIVEGLAQFISGIIGEKHAREFVPYFTTIFLSITVFDMMGVIPGLKSPTNLFSNCLAMALIVFFSTQYLGFRRQGWHYLKHFLGDPLWMAPMMLPVHVIGEISRPISLTFRLFGNIMGEDMVMLILLVVIFPLLIPVPMLCMMAFTDLIQALVFTTLACIYIKGAIESEGH